MEVVDYQRMFGLAIRVRIAQVRMARRQSPIADVNARDKRR
jgi:hypothetical protein